MGIFGDSIQRFITDTFSNGQRMVVDKEPDGSFFYHLSSSNVDYPYKTLFETYRNIPHVRAIVNKKLSFFSNLRVKIIKTNTTEEEVDLKHPLNAIITNPNVFQSWRQMLAMVSLYKSVGGVAFLFPGWGFKSYDPSYLAFIKNIEYESVTVNENSNYNALTTDDVDELIKSFAFTLKNGQKLKYKPSELIQFKDSFYSYTDNTSRLSTGRLLIENIYKAYTNRGILMDAHGGIGIISGANKDGGVSVPMTRKEKKRLNSTLDGYGLGGGKNPIILTDVPLRYTPMVFPTADLLLFEEIVDDFNGLCDLFEMARELFVGDAAYAATREAAERETYTNTILPEWEDFLDLLNDNLNTAKDNIKIVPDTAHIGSLQTSESLLLDTQIKKSTLLMAEMDKGIINLDEYRQQMGYSARVKV